MAQWQICLTEKPADECDTEIGNVLARGLHVRSANSEAPPDRLGRICRGVIDKFEFCLAGRMMGSRVCELATERMVLDLEQNRESNGHCLSGGASSRYGGHKFMGQGRSGYIVHSCTVIAREMTQEVPLSPTRVHSCGLPRWSIIWRRPRLPARRSLAH